MVRIWKSVRIVKSLVDKFHDWLMSMAWAYSTKTAKGALEMCSFSINLQLFINLMCGYVTYVFG